MADVDAAASASVVVERLAVVELTKNGLTGSGSGFVASRRRKSSLELRTLSSRTGSSTTTEKKLFDMFG